MEAEQRRLEAQRKLEASRKLLEKMSELLKENAALKVMTDELGQTLENHVKAHVSIIKDLDDEMIKADKQVRAVVLCSFSSLVRSRSRIENRDSGDRCSVWYAVRVLIGCLLFCSGCVDSVSFRHVKQTKKKKPWRAAYARTD